MRLFHKNCISTSLAVFVFGLSLAASCFAQAPPSGDPEGFGRPHGRHGGPGGPGGLQIGPPGRWWDNPDFSQKLSLSTDQQKKMDDIFNASRLKLIDLFASVQKEEAIMEPLVSADPPDDNKVLSQIDRVAQARAELEKARARMSLDIRRQLTHDQWVQLQAMRPPMHGPRHHGGPPSGDESPKPPSN
jgi:Spy/CpxP family protein refolding chaperone